MIIYCDRCKWDDMTGSKFLPDNGEEVGCCPVCGSELFEAEHYEDIP